MQIKADACHVQSFIDVQNVSICGLTNYLLVRITTALNNTFVKDVEQADSSVQELLFSLPFTLYPLFYERIAHVKERNESSDVYCDSFDRSYKSRYDIYQAPLCET